MCTIDNTICPMMKRCVDERRWKPLSGMEGCLKNPENNIPEGYLRVCMRDEEHIYVENGDFIDLIPWNGEDVIAVKLDEDGDIAETYG